MQFELDFARRFREAANLLRSVASGDSNIKASGLLDRIAQEYDRTAADLDVIGRANPVEPPARAPATAAAATPQASETLAA